LKFSYKIVNHERNSGIHQAKVTGLEYSQGEYVLFLDQDDEITDDYLYSQLQAIGTADVVVCNAFVECPDGTTIKFVRAVSSFKKAMTIDSFLNCDCQIISMGEGLIKKAAFPSEWQKNILKVNGADDYYLWLLMLSRQAEFVENTRYLYTHKYTGKNLSMSAWKIHSSAIAVFELLAYYKP